MDDKLAEESLRHLIDKIGERPPPSTQAELPHEVLQLIQLTCDRILKMEPEAKIIVSQIYGRFIPRHVTHIKEAYTAQFESKKIDSTQQSSGGDTKQSWKTVFRLNRSRQTLRFLSVILMAFKFLKNDADILSEKLILNIIPPDERKHYSVRRLVKSEFRILSAIDFSIHQPNYLQVAALMIEALRQHLPMLADNDVLHTRSLELLQLIGDVVFCRWRSQWDVIDASMALVQLTLFILVPTELFTNNFLPSILSTFDGFVSPVFTCPQRRQRVALFLRIMSNNIQFH